MKSLLRGKCILHFLFYISHHSRLIYVIFFSELLLCLLCYICGNSALSDDDPLFLQSWHLHTVTNNSKGRLHLLSSFHVDISFCPQDT
jgi:hypothetical protein